MIVTSFQDFKLREKQISPTFSYCGRINSLRIGTIVRCLQESKKKFHLPLKRNCLPAESIIENLGILFYFHPSTSV